MADSIQRTPAIMFQGTGSDVGKSLLVAGLCRVFARRGLKVRPFKPQNMSNNAAVTADGGEIGRAQALQARACGVPLSVHMNPVLLKPESDLGSQVVVQGKRIATVKARDYHGMKPQLLAAVLESFEKLEAEADLILVEGAGSPAEVNLRAGDIANMGFAEAADVPVVLIGDIDRGGVIAALVGTHAVIDPPERQRIQGFIINKFRGDVSLFDDGLKVVEAATSWPSLGVVTHCSAARRLPAEDAVSLDQTQASSGGKLRIALLKFSRIANHDDFDPLRLEPSVELILVTPGQAIPGNCDLVILPGSKSTIGDLAFLRAQGWDIDLQAHLRRGGRVLGICGGYQILGRQLHDPQGIEGPAGTVEGLGLLDVETSMTPEKTLTEVSGHLADGGQAVQGYEMHIGHTQGPDRETPFLLFEDHSDGAVSADGKVMGCYLHGLFSSDAARQGLLGDLTGGPESGLVFEREVESALDALADHLEREIDVDRVLALAQTR